MTLLQCNSTKRVQVCFSSNLHASLVPIVILILLLEYNNRFDGPISTLSFGRDQHVVHKYLFKDAPPPVFKEQGKVKERKSGPHGARSTYRTRQCPIYSLPFIVPASLSLGFSHFFFTLSNHIKGSVMRVDFLFISICHESFFA